MIFFIIFSLHFLHFALALPLSTLCLPPSIFVNIPILKYGFIPLMIVNYMNLGVSVCLMILCYGVRICCIDFLGLTILKVGGF